MRRTIIDGWVGLNEACTPTIACVVSWLGFQNDTGRRFYVTMGLGAPRYKRRN